VIGGQRVADQHAGVDAHHGELIVAQRVHQPVEVVGQGARVVAVLGLVGQPDGFGAPETEPGPSGVGRSEEDELMRISFSKTGRSLRLATSRRLVLSDPDRAREHPGPPPGQ
jgi:hypothetical protein